MKKYHLPVLLLVLCFLPTIAWSKEQAVVLRPQWSVTVDGRRRQDKLMDVTVGDNGSIYLLASDVGSGNSQLVKLDSQGKVVSRTDAELSANGVGADLNGSWIVGSGYNQHHVIVPHLVRVSPPGKIVFQMEIPAPIKVAKPGRRDSVWDLNPKGSGSLWQVHAVHGGGCIVLGVASGDESSIVYVQRIDENGKVLWSMGQPADVDQILAGSGDKLHPIFILDNQRILVAGPFRIAGGADQCWAAWLDLNSGKVLNTFSAKQKGDDFRSLTRDSKSKAIAIACKNGVLLLNDELTVRARLASNVDCWAGACFDQSGRIIVAGRIDKPGTSANDYMPRNFPAIGFASVSAGSKGQDPVVFSNERCWDEAMIVGPTPWLAYAIKLDSDPHTTSHTGIMVKRPQGKNWAACSYDAGALCNHPFALSTEQNGLVVAFEEVGPQNYSVRLLRF